MRVRRKEYEANTMHMERLTNDKRKSQKRMGTERTQNKNITKEKPMGIKKITWCVCKSKREKYNG